MSSSSILEKLLLLKKSGKTATADDIAKAINDAVGSDKNKLDHLRDTTAKYGGRLLDANDIDPLLNLLKTDPIRAVSVARNTPFVPLAKSDELGTILVPFDRVGKSGVELLPSGSQLDYLNSLLVKSKFPNKSMNVALKTGARADAGGFAIPDVKIIATPSVLNDRIVDHENKHIISQALHPEMFSLKSENASEIYPQHSQLAMAAAEKENLNRPTTWDDALRVYNENHFQGVPGDVDAVASTFINSKPEKLTKELKEHIKKQPDLVNPIPYKGRVLESDPMSRKDTEDLIQKLINESFENREASPIVAPTKVAKNSSVSDDFYSKAIRNGIPEEQARKIADQISKGKLSKTGAIAAMMAILSPKDKAEASMLEMTPEEKFKQDREAKGGSKTSLEQGYNIPEIGPGKDDSSMFDVKPGDLPGTVVGKKLTKPVASAIGAALSGMEKLDDSARELVMDKKDADYLKENDILGATSISNYLPIGGMFKAGTKAGKYMQALANKADEATKIGLDPAVLKKAAALQLDDEAKLAQDRINELIRITKTPEAMHRQSVNTEEFMRKLGIPTETDYKLKKGNP